MNKIIVSLLALGAMTGVAFADSDSEYDREGIDQNFGHSIINGYFGDNAGAGQTNAFAVPADQSGMTAFQRSQLDAKGELSDR
jgi:hypothetical protein